MLTEVEVGWYLWWLEPWWEVWMLWRLEWRLEWRLGLRIPIILRVLGIGWTLLVIDCAIDLLLLVWFGSGIRFGWRRSGDLICFHGG